MVKLRVLKKIFLCMVNLNFQDELSLIEINEELCNRMLDYKLHQEKKGIKRFSKQESSTAKAINKLRKRGVKVRIFFVKNYCGYVLLLVFVVDFPWIEDKIAKNAWI